MSFIEAAWQSSETVEKGAFNKWEKDHETITKICLALFLGGLLGANDIHLGLIRSNLTPGDQW